MRYFAEYKDFKKSIRSGISITGIELVTLYVQDNPPSVSTEGNFIREIADGTYFQFRSLLEESAGRCLADIVKNDTFHNIPYDGTMTLYERYQAAKERDTATSGEEV